MIDMTVMLEGETTDPLGLVSGSGQTVYLQRQPAPASPAGSGITMLKKQPGTGQAGYVPERADIAITISWLRYATDAIEIPIDSAIRLDSLD